MHAPPAAAHFLLFAVREHCAVDLLLVPDVGRHRDARECPAAQPIVTRTSTPIHCLCSRLQVVHEHELCHQEQDRLEANPTARNRDTMEKNVRQYTVEFAESLDRLEAARKQLYVLIHLQFRVETKA